MPIVQNWLLYSCRFHCYYNSTSTLLQFCSSGSSWFETLTESQFIEPGLVHWSQVTSPAMHFASTCQVQHKTDFSRQNIQHHTTRNTKQTLSVKCESDSGHLWRIHLIFAHSLTRHVLHTQKPLTSAVWRWHSPRPSVTVATNQKRAFVLGLSLKGYHFE